MPPRRFLPLLLLGLLAAPGLRAQDPALKDTFLQAKALWATQGDRDGATARFESVVAALAPRAATLDAAGTQMLCESYNWLAVLDDRNPATKARALTRLQALLDLNPDFDVDRTLTSQRLIGQFERLRSEKLAQVKLSYDPPGGTLTVDGRATPALARKFLPFGTHKLVYARPGHTPAEAAVELGPRDVKSVDFKLTRVSSTITFYVQPSGAEVFLDGRSLGRAQGVAGAEALDVAIPAGLRPEDLSAGFVLDGLKPGKHELELRAPCFRTKRLEIAASFTTPMADHVLQVVRLEPSKGTLSVASAWPGGELFLDGQDRGPLPIQKLPVCAGTYDLLVRFPSGGFAQRLTVAEGGAVSLEARPKPRLALLGLEGDQAFTGRDRLLALLQKLGDRLQQVTFLAPRPGEAPRAALDRLRAAHEAELFLTAVPVPDQVIHRVELVLSTADGETEQTLVQPLEEDPLGPLVARLNAPLPLQTRGIDATLLDLPGQPGPWVLAASEAAQKAGLQLQKPIVQVEGQPVTDAAALRRALGAKDRVTLSQGGAPVTLPVQQEPLELPLASNALAYPAVLAQLRLQYLGAKGDEAGLLKLDIGLALMHFHRYDKAIEVLRDAHVGATLGVSQGTLDYETGLCFLRLGSAYHSEAAQAFRQALKYPQATLFGPDGPLVAPLARQALEDLK
ncbi:hypothetical protein GETHPA_15420 [Geothrix rubra]|uniref:PEGA domain-containing protein n=1 Tax=Geothrix rubra TaxID=2927977 RepID=A0ABQ5Q677_9BACT|nr:hypothetical protein [Geothrix rubra]GLH70009.1 hypothetical protein GETHPA_15420 [Geothrix rubra]